MCHLERCTAAPQHGAPQRRIRGPALRMRQRLLGRRPYRAGAAACRSRGTGCIAVRGMHRPGRAARCLAAVAGGSAGFEQGARPAEGRAAGVAAAGCSVSSCPSRLLITCCGTARGWREGVTGGRAAGLPGGRQRRGRRRSGGGRRKRSAQITCKQMQTSVKQHEHLRVWLVQVCV